MATANTTITSEVFPPITLHDRCDRCSAAAQMRAVFLEGDLLFCGHHGRKNEEALKKAALYLQWKDSE